LSPRSLSSLPRRPPPPPLFPSPPLFRSLRLPLEPARDGTQLLAGVAPRILAACAMEPPIDERPRNRRRPLHVQEIMDDERRVVRSEEHTSELQSQSNLVCRLLLEKKKQK